MNTFGQGPTSWPAMRDNADRGGRETGRRRTSAPPRRPDATRVALAPPVHEEQSRDFVRQAMNEHYR
jgi:hypothetical protein